MSAITSPSRVSKDLESNKVDKLPPVADIKLEARLNTKDLEALQEAFMAEGDGYDDKLSLNKEQFCEALALILNKGSRTEYANLFDKIDVTKDGAVDWDKFASHMLLEFYERDDRVKSTQVPQWKNLKNLASPHKEIIQRVIFLKNTNRYISISKEGCVAMWSLNLKVVRSLKTSTDACRSRDLWITHFTVLPNINKIALSFTSKEIAIYDLSTKLEFNCQYKVQGLSHTPLCLDYWWNPNNANEAILTWGDTGGCVNALHFNSVNIALFDRPSVPAGEKQETCLTVQLKDVMKRKYRSAHFTKHQGHTEWVRQVVFSPNLECFISCATTWNNSLVIGWLEKHAISTQNMKTICNVIRMAKQEGKVVTRVLLIGHGTGSQFQISQGVNAFDYHPTLNLIATAGVNHHVCLWNPYVVSKPNGVLRGHMASVIQVQFNRLRGQLISFSKDKVLRIWDVQLQVCIQRLAGMFPKGPEVTSTLFFDERKNRLFLTFNYQLTVLEMKPEVKDRVLTHEKPVMAAVYNSTFNQVITACQNGSLVVWMVDTGQKVKQFNATHNNAELTCLAQDPSHTRLYTGSTDGTVKVWDFNGHCYHTLQCGLNGQPADVGQILVLKRSVLVVGWTRCITVFRQQQFREFHVLPAEWKGGQEHTDDILALSFAGSNMLASGAYNGEIIVWNNSSEQASKHLTQRARKQNLPSFTNTRQNTHVSDGGFDSHAYQSDRPRSKSRCASRISLGSTDETNEYGHAVTRLVFLESRKLHRAGQVVGANLASCGGNGWVRFWNTSQNQLVAEFVAHTQVGSVIMATDTDNHWLATGDVDGLVKVWNISEYCVTNTDDVITEPPCLQCQFNAHTDMINSLELCTRNQRILILSASSDCSVALWDVYGNQIGIFGQEDHWKIEPYVPKTESELADEERQSEAELQNQEEQQSNSDEQIESDDDSLWEPDSQATENPAHYRMNTWEKTCLGKDYQELRVQKRERRQPEVIKDLPYLHWEKTGQPPAGPYGALGTTQLEDVASLEKPDFMHNPHKYFSERSADDGGRLPALAESLKAAFDEKTLFPKFILDFEARMKQFHSKTLAEQQKKAGQGLLRAALGGATSSSTSTVGRGSTAAKRPPQGKLKPIPRLSIREES